MFSLRLHLRPLTWLALVALLALAVLPTLSHALAFARGNGGGWAEVCTPQGMRLVQVEAGASPTASAPAQPMQAAAHLEHCPFCAMHGLDLAPPPAAATLPLTVALAEAPPLFFQAPAPLFAWRSAQPRGPPALS